MDDLGFVLELRGNIWGLQYDNNGGCHPASDAEIAMWALLTQQKENSHG